MRLFKFLECFERAYAVLDQGYRAASTAQYDRADFAMTTMEVGKWSMLGMYFLLENFTIVRFILPSFCFGLILIFDLILSC